MGVETQAHGAEDGVGSLFARVAGRVRLEDVVAACPDAVRLRMQWGARDLDEEEERRVVGLVGADVPGPLRQEGVGLEVDGGLEDVDGRVDEPV